MHQQTHQSIREDLDTLESFVQVGLNLPYGPYVLFKRLAARYPRHFIQFMERHRPGGGAGQPTTVDSQLPLAQAAVAELSATLEHYLTCPPQTGEERTAFQQALDGLENRLWMGTFREPGFTHFLDLDQYTDDPQGYGIESLFYHLDGPTLRIRLTGAEGDVRGTQTLVAGAAPGVKEALSGFLLHYRSQPGNRTGDNHYLWSNLFSRAEWDDISRQGWEVIAARQEAARQLGEHHELLAWCRAQGLDTRPEGSHETRWLASCPSGGNHPIRISTATSQWDCPYCRKKGGLQELREWIENTPTEGEK